MAADRLRDKLLWALVALAVLCVVAYFIADDYYTSSGAFDCFPACTFKQDLSNNVSGAAPFVAVLFAVAAGVRWFLLGRQAPERGGSDAAA